MIYTCYEMVQDCRANKPEGWVYFLTNYVPLIRELLAHYGDSGALERVLLGIRKPESSMFQSLEPAPERWSLPNCGRGCWRKRRWRLRRLRWTLKR